MIESDISQLREQRYWLVAYFAHAGMLIIGRQPWLVSDRVVGLWDCGSGAVGVGL